MNDRSSNIVRSDEVIGKAVKNLDKQHLGEIEEIVLDKLTGQVHYVVLSFGGLLGLGDKFFAIPWNAISYSPGDKCFILNVSKDKLKDAPGFDKDHWPDMAAEQWHNIDAFYSSSINH